MKVLAILLFFIFLKEHYRKSIFHIIPILVIVRVIYTEQASMLDQKIKL